MPRSSLRSLISDRQLVILNLLAQGGTDRDIAGELGISDRQVRREVDALKGLLDARGRFQLAVKAERAGLIPRG